MDPYRNSGMLGRLACHKVKNLLLNKVLAATRGQAAIAAMLRARRSGHFVLLLLGLLFAPLHRTLVLRDDAFRPHTHGQALFQAALLTLSPHVHVHFAGAPELAAVDGALRNAASKEPLAALTGEGVVVVAGGPVAANQAQLLLHPWRRSLLALLRIAAFVRRVSVQAARRREIIATCPQKEGETNLIYYGVSLATIH